MSNGQKWLVQDDSTNYLIDYDRSTPGGQAKISINGVPDTYVLSQVNEAGYFTPLPCGSRECVIKIALDGSAATLYVDGVVQEPLDFAEQTRAQGQGSYTAESSILQKRIKSGMGSFLTLILLSLINNILIWLNASISFPFSIFTASLATGFGQTIAEESGDPLFNAGGIIISILIIAAYTSLYLLARRRIWPAWVAFALIVADTLLLIGFALLTQDFVSFALDLVFHIWIIWSLLRLGQAKSRLGRLVLEKITP